MYKDKWTQPWPMGSEMYLGVHENPRAFFSSSSSILLEPLAHGSSNWSLPREDSSSWAWPRRKKGWPKFIWLGEAQVQMNLSYSHPSNR